MILGIKKRGLSHIEMVISFVFFVGFLIFALAFFNPLDTERVLDASLFYANDEISDNVSIEIESYSVKLEEGIAQIIEIPISSDIDNAKSRVETYDGQKLPSNYQNGGITLDRSGSDFIIIKLSQDFENDDISGGEVLQDEDFIFSSYDIKEIFSEKRLLELNKSYYRNYDALRESFNLPRRVDFGFSVVFSEDDKIISEGDIPEGLEVVANQERVEILRNNGEIVFGDFNFKVW